ncbi:MAG: methylated-DNA--[protein]-cysteine S-methyltransferase [Dermatophilaceae bacterium]
MDVEPLRTDAGSLASDAATDRSRVVDSPIGRLELVERHGALVGIRFDGSPATRSSAAAMPPGPARFGGSPADPPGDEVGAASVDVLAEAHRQLAEYFAGERRVFDLPLRPAGTAFQQRVWTLLATVPWGSTTTYGKLAAWLGMPPGAARAVGAANGANPVPIVLPCHRVVGSDGTLTGYAGGLERKASLLALEGGPTEPDQASLF